MGLRRGGLVTGVHLNGNAWLLGPGLVVLLGGLFLLLELSTTGIPLYKAFLCLKPR